MTEQLQKLAMFQTAGKRKLIRKRAQVYACACKLKQNCTCPKHLVRYFSSHSSFVTKTSQPKRSAAAKDCFGNIWRLYRMQLIAHFKKDAVNSEAPRKETFGWLALALAIKL